MARIRDDFARGTLTLDVTDSDTNLTSEEFSELDEVASPDIIVLTLDPLGFFGDPEIVYVTDHSAGATPNQNVTVLRGQEDTTARSHPATTRWVNTATAYDHDRPDYIQATARVYDLGQVQGVVTIDPSNGSSQRFQANGTVEITALNFEEGDFVDLEILNLDGVTVSWASTLDFGVAGEPSSIQQRERFSLFNMYENAATPGLAVGIARVGSGWAA